MHIVHLFEADHLAVLYRFRRYMYGSHLAWLDPQRDHLCDEFDGFSYNYAAIDEKGRVVGSVRVVPDSDLGLPLERCFPLDGLRDGRHMVEICRLAVAPWLRGSRVGGLLMKAAYQCSVAIGATHIVLDTYVGRGTSEPLYEKMGLERGGRPYADPTYHCDLPVIPFALDVARALREWPSQHPDLYRFFTSPDPEIVHG